MANDYVGEHGTPKIALNGMILVTLLIIAAKQMLTEEIFLDPNVRKYFREQLMGGKSRPSRAGYSVKPTEKGLKKIDDSHPYYVYPE